ncbi:MAG TPA: type 1 glutamine amidotransferase domain-containing protein [Pirellulaceae bacterium]|nr:type 1 glutamine amidotransferase domain-containing protein [Pirellulaceae bacterium]HMO91530.1 type 1 glutamine amidotransferase domain-containing protein [Pirellulaceae bacterium]HMP68227.1 type 1 glutamine amidotransferase domain-containing protein [Pirellulaceae bacterium]
MSRPIAIFVEQIYEDMELQYPRFRLLEAGYQVCIVGPEAGETYKGKHGYPQKSDIASADVSASDFGMIIIPGGFAPDFMRRDHHLLRLVQEAADENIPMAAICHGVWMFCSTHALQGRRCTSFYAIAHDVVNAGAIWVDEECVVDGNLITSRTPADLPAFMKSVIQMLDTAKAEGSQGKPVAPHWLQETLNQPTGARG